MASFIDDIKKITDKQFAFVANSQEDNTNSLAAYLFGGEFSKAKYIDGSNIRKMLSSFALEFIRKETVLKTIADQYYPFTTIDFLETWEKALRIPDDCFKVDRVSIEQRQKQIIAKLAIDKIITKEDFIALARFFGYAIKIEFGFQASVFPATFPLTLDGEPKERKFTITVTFLGITPVSGFPYTFPFTFQDQDPLQFLQCLITKLAPANVNVIFKSQP